MAFTADNARSFEDFEPRNFPTPKEGSRKARVSLIVDLGTQDQESLWELNGKMVPADTEGATEKTRKACRQVAVFADLTADTVDYGGDIGKAHYRIPLNRVFKGEFTGIALVKSPPMDANGKRIDGKEWGLHPQNPLHKLAKATGKDSVIESTDVSLLLNAPFMAQVEVKKTAAKGDKKDKDGNPIIYTNVNYKGATQVPTQEDDDGKDLGPLPVPALKVPALAIQFSDAKKEDIKYIRASLIKKIKLAHNYAGSQMQKAIEAYEAEKAAASGDDDDSGDDTPAAPAPAPKPAPKANKPKPVVPQDDDEDGVPF